MLIALDIGNSHVKLGGFDGDDMKFVASIATDERQTGEQYACTLQNVFSLYGVPMCGISGAVLCSVVPVMPPILQRALALLVDCPVLCVSSGVKTGLNVKIDQPRALGSDLVANAVWAMHGGQVPCVVVDLGTATTFTVIDGRGVLTGTAITAGMGSVLGALKRDAAQLPTVLLEEPQHLAGKNTADAIRSGVVYGTAAMIDGMLSRFAAQLGETPTVLLTGGGAALITRFLQTPHVFDAHVTLRGLQLIWKKNRG